jgi:hypothetical protein
MGAIKIRKIAVRNLNNLSTDPTQVLFIHYSQSRTYEDDYGQISPIITSIVVKSLDGEVDKQFAIHFEADKAGIPIDEIQDSYRELELRILRSFNEFVKRNKHCFWVHWDMKNIHFGFEAIKHRFEKIFEGVGDYCDIPSNQKRNLHFILEGIYGDKFVNGPDHLKNLMLCNNNDVVDTSYISQENESIEFEHKNFDSVIRSVDTKVEFLRIAVKKLLLNKLLVVSRNRYAIFVDIVTHPVMTFIGWLATIAGLGFCIYSLIK